MTLSNLPARLSKMSSHGSVPMEMKPLYQERKSDWKDGTVAVKSKFLKKSKRSLNCLRHYECPHMGLVLAVGSSLMFSLCSLLVKVLKDVPSTEIAVFRFIGVLLPTIPLVIARGDPLFPRGYRLILIVRCIFGTTSLMLQFYSFQHLPLGDASVIVFSAPVFVAIFAKVFLKEDCGLFQVVLILLTLTGVTLVTRPPWLLGTLSSTYEASEWKGAIAAFAGTIVAANVYILLRILKKLHYSVILFDFSIVALLITPFATAVSSHPCVPYCGSQRWMIVAIGFLSFCGQILKTKALQMEEAGPVAIARTSDVIFAFIWQFVFFGEIPDTLSLLGALLVTSCVLLLGIRKWVLSLPKSSSIRKYLVYLTW